MKKFYLIFLVYFIAGSAFAQTYRLFGITGEASVSFRDRYSGYRTVVTFNKPK